MLETIRDLMNVAAVGKVSISSMFTRTQSDEMPSRHVFSSHILFLPFCIRIASCYTSGCAAMAARHFPRLRRPRSGSVHEPESQEQGCGSQQHALAKAQLAGMLGVGMAPDSQAKDVATMVIDIFNRKKYLSCINV